jgi:hypothetical protein
VFHNPNKGKNVICNNCKSDDIDHINKSIKNWRQRDNSKNVTPEVKSLCVCPNCNYKEPHQRGIPCFSIICPNCNIPLVRQDK